MHFSFSKVQPAKLRTALHLYAPTARTALQCVRADRAHAAYSTRITLVQCIVVMAEGDFEKTQPQCFLRTLNFNFCELQSAHLHTAPHPLAHTARTFLQCLRADRANAALSKLTMSAECFLQMAEANFEKFELQCFLRTLSFSFSETGPAHLHTSRHCRPQICSRKYAATQQPHVAFYSSKDVGTHQWEYTI